MSPPRNSSMEHECVMSKYEFRGGEPRGTNTTHGKSTVKLEQFAEPTVQIHKRRLRSDDASVCQEPVPDTS